MRRTTYGQKGGEGPNRGKKATTYIVTLPDGSTAQKRDFNPPVNPAGYAYQHQGMWYVAAISERDDARFSHYRQCPVQDRDELLQIATRAIAASRQPTWEQTAEAHGAKLDQAENGMWRLLDQPGTVLWWAYFLDRRTAAYAYCLHHQLVGR